MKCGPFDTYDEALAFAAGIAFVNDSSVHATAIVHALSDDEPYYVRIEDEDADPDTRPDDVFEVLLPMLANETPE